MTINQLSADAFSEACRRGFYAPGRVENFGELLAGVHSELSEAFEADRLGRNCAPNFLYSCSEPRSYEILVKDTVEAELADAMIRLAAIAQYIGMDLEKQIEAGLEYGKTRPHLNGKRY